MEPRRPKYPKDLIAIYRAFNEQVYSPQSVLYPSCEWDASPSKVFDNVTYVDREDFCKGAMEVFRRHGLRAFCMDIRDYRPEEPHDLLILLNPKFPTAWAAPFVASGGYIFSNNWHSNASQMFHDPSTYTLWGTINILNKSEKGTPPKIEVSTDTTDLFIPVENGEELKKLRTAEYESIMQPNLGGWHDERGAFKRKQQEPPITFEEKYRQRQRSLKLSEELPAKRVADYYIFTKTSTAPQSPS